MGFEKIAIGVGVLGEIQVSLALVNYVLIRVVRSSYSLDGGTVGICETQSFFVLSTHLLPGESLNRHSSAREYIILLYVYFSRTYMCVCVCITYV